MRYQVPFFESLVWFDLGLNPRLLGHWHTLYTFVQWAGHMYIYIYILIASFEKGPFISFTSLQRNSVAAKSSEE